MAICVSIGPRFAAMMAAAVVGAMGSAASAGGTVFTAAVTADENGNGTLTTSFSSGPMPGVMTADTTVGGLPAALFYNMLSPPSLVFGDLLISEVVGGPVSDVIRFTSVAGQYGFFFYSDIDGVIDGIADVGLPNTPLTSNYVFGVETTLPDGNIGMIYHPGPNDPGFVSGYDVTYTFISDIVPAPGAAAIVGFGGLLAARRRRS